MAVTFPNDIHPSKGFRLRFKYNMRAYQYLEFFKITTYSPTVKFVPLELTFENHHDLHTFLTNRSIVYKEINVTDGYWKDWEEITIVDTMKIFNVDESIQKYLLNYKLYSINEVAEMLSFSRPTVYKLVNNQSLKAVRIQGQLRINHLDLMAFIENEENEKIKQI